MSRPAPEAGARSGRAEWASTPERSNMFMLRVMTWISLRLGRPAGRLVLHGIAAYFLLFNPSARRASRDYLGRVLGRKPGLADIYRHIFCFAATIHDRVYLLNDRFDLFDLQVEGAEHIHSMLEGGHGALLFGAHLGSFEVTRAVGRQRPELSIALAMYAQNAQKIGAALAAINPAAQPEIIPLGQLDAMLRVRQRLEEGALVGILADRTPGGEPTQNLDFLGTPAAFPIGPFRMAVMLKAPVIFMAGLHLGGNRYRIRFIPLADFSTTPREGRDEAIRAAMADYVGLLEDCCRAAPCNWFNFFEFWRDGGRAS